MWPSDVLTPSEVICALWGPSQKNIIHLSHEQRTHRPARRKPACSLAWAPKVSKSSRWPALKGANAELSHHKEEALEQWHVHGLLFTPQSAPLCCPACFSIMCQEPIASLDLPHLSERRSLVYLIDFYSLCFSRNFLSMLYEDSIIVTTTMMIITPKFSKKWSLPLATRDLETETMKSNHLTLVRLLSKSKKHTSDECREKKILEYFPGEHTNAN